VRWRVGGCERSPGARSSDGDKHTDPKGQIMVRYFYAWTPFVIVGTVFILALPWLGLVALMFASLFAFVALAGLVWAIVYVPYTLGRAIGHRWHVHGGATSLTPAAVRAPARRQSV
jgi:hypothetical protein